MQPWHGPYWVLPGKLNAGQAPSLNYQLSIQHFPDELHAYFRKLSERLFWQFVGNCKIFAQNNSIGFVDDWFWHFSLDWILVWAAELDWNISISFQGVRAESFNLSWLRICELCIWVKRLCKAGAGAALIVGKWPQGISLSAGPSSLTCTNVSSEKHRFEKPEGWLSHSVNCFGPPFTFQMTTQLRKFKKFKSLTTL